MITSLGKPEKLELEIDSGKVRDLRKSWGKVRELCGAWKIALVELVY